MPDFRATELTEPEIAEIKELSAAKLGICKKQNDIIGQQIFSILNHCTDPDLYLLFRKMTVLRIR